MQVFFCVQKANKQCKLHPPVNPFIFTGAAVFNQFDRVQEPGTRISRAIDYQFIVSDRFEVIAPENSRNSYYAAEDRYNIIFQIDNIGTFLCMWWCLFQFCWLYVP